jgi:16S rRNA A1518/A1519 N6-dimethyltransferase RsmA/KsgA/DIM1 with predicted DNA glycosylase/AP lyase activity
LEEAAIESRKRPESLGLEDFLRLAHTLPKKAGKGKRNGDAMLD